RSLRVPLRVSMDRAVLHARPRGPPSARPATGPAVPHRARARDPDVLRGAAPRWRPGRDLAGTRRPDADDLVDVAHRADRGADRRVLDDVEDRARPEEGGPDRIGTRGGSTRRREHRRRARADRRHATMTLRVGTSGWNYRHWRGPVYAPGVPTREWLGAYT